MLQRTALVRKGSNPERANLCTICSLQTTAFPNKDEEDAPAWASSELLDHLGLWGLDFALNCLILVG